MAVRSRWSCVMLWGVSAVLAAGAVVRAKENRGRVIKSFDFDWKFFKGDASGADKPEFDDSRWRALKLPHDWSIEGPFDQGSPSGRSGGYLPAGIGWYRKHFQLSGRQNGRKVFIQFDGVYHNSEAWINGHHLGRRPYGYISFQYDLSGHLKFGSDNVLSVRVDNSDQPNCRWYSGSGIYRHVWLIVVDKLHVDHWGTYVTTPRASKESAAVNIKTEIVNEYDEPQRCTLVTTLIDSAGGTVGRAARAEKVPPGGRSELAQAFEVARPELWSTENPVLYHADSTIKLGDSPVDTYRTPFGIRAIRFDKDQGFFLNGKNMKMKGVCIHHDAGCLGAAVPDGVLERRLEVLKQLGCNAIRTSHNPPAPELLDMCDRMGFVVMDEAFDKWDGEAFEQWWQADLTAMLRRDRNHPSIVLWSVGNELRQQGSAEGNRILKMLVDFVHQHEPTRPVTCAITPVGDRQARVNRSGFAELMDVVSLNYQEPWYESDRAGYPDRIIVGSESYPYYRGDGDAENDGNAYKGFVEQNPWFDVVRHDYVVGQFLWIGIDYLGEGRPWPSKGNGAGLIDTCGFRKARSYFHESVWADRPMVHIAVFDESAVYPMVKPHWGWPKIADHWTFPELAGRNARLVTYTNCETVELILNGRSRGTKRLADFPNRYMTWEIPYEEGAITARGRNGDRVVAEYVLKTAGRAARVVLKPDRTEMASDGREVCHVEVNVTDATGVLCPRAANLITFTIEGPGRIIGVDNGNLDGDEPYKAARRSAFHGKCLAIVQSTRQSGRIRLTATAPGLSSDSVIIGTQEQPEGNALGSDGPEAISRE